MIQSASLLTINNVPVTTTLVLEILWPSLIAALVPIVLALALLSFDNLMDTGKPFSARLKSAPIGNPFAWGLFSVSIGTFIFGVVFIAQLLMRTTTMGTYRALGYGLAVVVTIDIICAIVLIVSTGVFKDSDRDAPSLRAALKRKINLIIS